LRTVFISLNSYAAEFFGLKIGYQFNNEFSAADILSNYSDGMVDNSILEHLLSVQKLQNILIHIYDL
jgi:predicted lactoylglutathione lyase